MATADIALTVPAVPTVTVPATGVIAETPVATGPISLTVPAVPTVAVSTSVLSNYAFAGGLLKVNPTMIGRTSIADNAPQYWFQWGNNLVIEPIPDTLGEYQILLHIADYPRRELGQFYTSPDELPDEFHPCIVDFACYVLSMKLKKWKQAVKYYNLYIKNLKKRKKDYIERKAERRVIHHIPDNVKYENGALWAH